MAISDNLSSRKLRNRNIYVFFNNIKYLTLGKVQLCVF